MPAPSIILTGLPTDHTAVPEHIRPQLSKMFAELDIAMAQAGYQYKFVPTSPETGIDNLLSELRGGTVDGLVIGMGVRQNPELTHFMEQIINSSVEVRPGLKIMFNTLVPNTIDAARRWFPIQQ